jgi:hypothetical protein
MPHQPLNLISLYGAVVEAVACVVPIAAGAGYAPNILSKNVKSNQFESFIIHFGCF